MSEDMRCPNPDCRHLVSVHDATSCKVQVCSCKGVNPTFVSIMEDLEGITEDNLEQALLDAASELPEVCPNVTCVHPFESHSHPAGCAECDCPITGIIKVPGLHMPGVPGPGTPDTLSVEAPVGTIAFVDNLSGGNREINVIPPALVNPDEFFPTPLLGEVIEFLANAGRDGILLAEKLNRQTGASARRRLARDAQEAREAREFAEGENAAYG